jgi:hypothetical protein
VEVSCETSRVSTGFGTTTPRAEPTEGLHVQLADGRTISAPLEWYPRLYRATPAQRANWRLIGEGDGIHWPDVDEDISTIMLIEGLPSIEYEKAKTG